MQRCVWITHGKGVGEIEGFEMDRYSRVVLDLRKMKTETPERQMQTSHHG